MGRLLEELHAIPPSPARSPVCKVGQYLLSLGGEELDDFRACIDSEVSGRALSVLFRSFNYDVGRSVIQEHRGKRCACYTKGLIDG